MRSHLLYKRSAVFSRKSSAKWGILKRPHKMIQVKLRLTMEGQIETKIPPLCEELGITKQTLYRYVSIILFPPSAQINMYD